MAGHDQTYKTRKLAIFAVLLLPCFLLFVLANMNTSEGAPGEWIFLLAFAATCISVVAYGLSMLSVSIELSTDALVYRRTGRRWTIPYTAIRGWKYTTQHYLLDIDNPIKKVHVYLVNDIQGLLRELERRAGYLGEIV